MLDTIAACGDVNRNVIASVNPWQSRVACRGGTGWRRRSATHLLPKSRAWHEIWIDGEQLSGGEEEDEPIYGRTYMPRKFKIAVAVPPHNDVDVFAHDLGFIAIERGRSHRRLQRGGRRRHGHDAWRARHLPAHRRRDRLLHAGSGGGCRARRSSPCSATSAIAPTASMRG